MEMEMEMEMEMGWGWGLEWGIGMGMSILPISRGPRSSISSPLHQPGQSTASTPRALSYHGYLQPYIPALDSSHLPSPPLPSHPILISPDALAADPTRCLSKAGDGCRCHVALRGSRAVRSRGWGVLLGVEIKGFAGEVLTAGQIDARVLTG
ncbi:hypothetical protein P167DRAFT_366335 [Morchella conica CCBAS932]|uniref:Uncharacterized protein n=1 Tax=Morchella conica CCBAS932 TaxID=1392247 RepID=A0A3N4KC91_9PEZI|nr:hypothetical protein P167DRAFT_366335 [Morchella conica CCBAS932]